PQVVGAPFAASRSFAPYGMPSSGRRSRRASAASARFASARARSRMTVATALYRGPTRARRSHVSSASSTAEITRLRKRFCSSAMVAKRWSLMAGRPSAALSRWERVVYGSRSRAFRPLRAPRPRVERDRRWDACLPAARSARSRSFAPFLSQNPQDSVIPSVNGVAADAASVSHRRAPAFAARLRHAGRLVGLELGATGADVDHAAAGSGQHGRANSRTVRDDHRVTWFDAHRGGAAAFRQDHDADGPARFPTERDAPRLHPRLGRDLRLPRSDAPGRDAASRERALVTPARLSLGPEGGARLPGTATRLRARLDAARGFMRRSACAARRR